MRFRWLILLFVGPVYGDISPELERVSRYGAVRLLPTAAQEDPLSGVVEFSFPSGLSVGQAIDRMLRHSGYRLPEPASRAPELSVLFGLPLPASFGHVGPVPLRAALGALVGEAWVPVIDPVYRYISFDLRPEYREHIAKPEPTPSVTTAAAEVDAPPTVPAATPAPAAPGPGVVREWSIPSLATKSATRNLNELRAALGDGHRVVLRYSSERSRKLLIRSMARREIAANRVDWVHDSALPSFGAVARIVSVALPTAADGGSVPAPRTLPPGVLQDVLARYLRTHWGFALHWTINRPFRTEYPVLLPGTSVDEDVAALQAVLNRERGAHLPPFSLEAATDSRVVVARLVNRDSR